MIRFILLIIIFCSCSMQKPVSMAHVERIEERVMPIPVGADTIEITLPHTENNWLTEPKVLSLGEKRTDNTEDAVATPAEDRFISDFEQSEKSKFRELRGFRERTNNSVREKESSVRNNNSVRIKSTRGVNISRHETDTTSTLRITLRPDTVFVPYTNHIRSDTIVVPDRICQQKLNHSNMTNLFLILILIMIIIIFLKNRMTR